MDAFWLVVQTFLTCYGGWMVGRWAGAGVVRLHNRWQAWIQEGLEAERNGHERIGG